LRRGEWAEAAEVSGIECVGLVKSCPGGEFPVGATVAALMGGFGRTVYGSYAEDTRAPATNVALIEFDLSWAQLAALPEAYATAWTCLFRNLEIANGQRWLSSSTKTVRGINLPVVVEAFPLSDSIELHVVNSADRFATVK
jgi:NADPH:quinone reductase-like Zn-dependent oxidoreductase